MEGIVNQSLAKISAIYWDAGSILLTTFSG